VHRLLVKVHFSMTSVAAARHRSWIALLC